MTEQAPGTPLPPAVVTNTVGGDATLHTSVQAGTIGAVHFHQPRHEPPAPRQLRPVAPAWTDREQEQAQLTRWIETQPEYAVPIAVLTGPVGIGKTALAERLLHGLSARYPGGQLHVDLRGQSPDGPARPGEVLGRMLRSILPGPLPAGAEELAAWWRSASAARPPMCLLLDGVSHADQIHHLLPGGSGHLVVATSRIPLPELARHGAATLGLSPLDHAAARSYLTRCLGPDRVQQETEAVTELIRLTAGLPLALALSITQLARHPDRPLSAAVRALSERRRWTASTSPAPDLPGAIVTSALDTAYADLSRPAARLYRQLARLPVESVDSSLAAAVALLTPAEAAHLLQEVSAGGLLVQDGDHRVRGPVWRYSSAALAHARHHAALEQLDGAESEARRRAADSYLAAATAAERLLTPSHRQLDRTYVYPAEHPVEFPDRAAALSWLDTQSANLLAVIRAAHAAGSYGTVWQLVHAMWPWWRAARMYDAWIEAHRLGLEAALLYNHEIAVQEMANTLGIGLRGVRAFDEAGRCFTDVLASARERGDARGEAQALHELGATAYEAGRPEEAVGHLEQARTLRERREDRRGVALTDILLGQVQLSRGDAAAAVEVLAAARAALVEVDDPHDAARALAWLGRAYSMTGRHDEARQAGATAQQEFERTGSRQWMARSLELLGESVAAAGREQEAQEFFARALASYEPLSATDAARVRARLT
ncbi:MULTISPECIES: tetratricopeptide repeat protein [Streptomyces]|uniref:Tetratricopeptide repeat protein n=1 Tax=Streptomyces griseiscabiei TaxID=2993540 RepID=A0ABU4LDS8_9ACTN|nr:MULTISPECIES: tetratricopeptide repeat protein [Streptomyces]MBZ3908425.1 tetratricopeptide repeat protein [Streptomyces griseiscabiei]MDX2913942.1 tetratricopeptide repeat protein [Streptomyces griseiscabiei]